MRKTALGVKAPFPGFIPPALATSVDGVEHGPASRSAACFFSSRAAREREIWIPRQDRGVHRQPPAPPGCPRIMLRLSLVKA
jgi:hypothetical protein